MFRLLKPGENPLIAPEEPQKYVSLSLPGNKKLWQYHKRQKYTFKPYEVPLRDGQKAHVLGGLMFMNKDVSKGRLLPRDTYTGAYLPRLANTLNAPLNDILFRPRYVPGKLSPESRQYMQKVYQASGIPGNMKSTRYHSAFSPDPVEGGYNVWTSPKVGAMLKKQTAHYRGGNPFVSKQVSPGSDRGHFAPRWGNGGGGKVVGGGEAFKRMDQLFRSFVGGVDDVRLLNEATNLVDYHVRIGEMTKEEGDAQYELIEEYMEAL